MTDFVILKEKMKPYKLEFIACQLGITRQTLYDKLNNHTEFKQSEIRKLSEVLELTADEVNAIFFS